MRTRDAEPDIVSVVLRAGDVTAEVVAGFAEQSYPALDVVVVVGGEESLAPFLGRPRVQALRRVAGGEPGGDLVAGAYVLEASGEVVPRRTLVANMVAFLESEAGASTVASDGGALNGGVAAFRLTRRYAMHGRAGPCTVFADGALAAECGGDGVDLLPVSELPAAAARGVHGFLLASADRIGGTLHEALRSAHRTVAWFEGDSDLPYRFRTVLRRRVHLCASADRETAVRLQLITPRSTWSPSPRDAVRAEPGGAAGEARYAFVPLAAPSGRRHVVIQAGDFTEGGMETVMLDVAEALRAAGLSVTLLVLGVLGNAAAEAERRRIPVAPCPPDEATYERFLAEHDVALVNAHYSTFGAGVCARRGIPFVQSMHNVYQWFRQAQIDEYRAAEAHTRGYVCVSDNVARYADVRLGLSARKMIVIPNGCDAAYRSTPEGRERGRKIRGELGLTDGDRLFLNVASIQPTKAQHLLVEAMARVGPSCPRAHVGFLGRPADEAYAAGVRRRVRELGLDARAHWLGHRADVPDCYAAADALVMPSFLEGWSLAITEAVLAELPVIATDVGGAAEQLCGTEGIVVRPATDDPTAVDAERLIALLDEPCEDLQQRLATAIAAVYRRGRRRSPLPDDWEWLTRTRAYERYVHVFRWLMAGGSPAAARYWTRDAAALPAQRAELSGAASP